MIPGVKQGYFSSNYSSQTLGIQGNNGVVAANGSGGANNYS